MGGRGPISWILNPEHVESSGDAEISTFDLYVVAKRSNHS